MNMRAGDLGFSVRVDVDRPAATDRRRAADRTSGARLCAVEPVQVPGNALDAREVRTAHGCVDAGRGATVATYPAGAGTGTLDLRARLVGARAASVHLTWTAL